MRGFGKRRWRLAGEGLKVSGAALLVVAFGVAATLWIAPLAPPDSPAAPPAGPASSVIERAFAERSAEAMRIVQQLCAPEFAGRKAGTPGADRAADWLAGELKRIGLAPPPGAPEFRQPFTMPVSLIASRWDRKAKLIGPAAQPPGGKSARTRPVRRPTAWIEYPCFRGGGFSVEAEAVFAGWGISRRDQGWDDYRGPDVRGKYVVFWEGSPGPGLGREQHARWRDAKRRGALGCLMLSRRPEEPPAGLESPIRDFPVLRLDPATAARVLNAPIPAPGAPSTRPLAPLRIEIPRAEDPARSVANVVGMIRGVDPELAGETVILSAHYDHLGALQAGTRGAGDGDRRVPAERVMATGGNPMARPNSRGSHSGPASTVDYRLSPGYFPGADDDASGVAVVLGVARGLVAAGARPRRSILFCLWTAEECGLLGSRAYAMQPLLPLEKTRFMLQVEMVGAGRADRFETSAARSAGRGHAALQAAAGQLGLSLANDDCRGVSDHLSFTRRGVPALVLTTAGQHPDYHTPGDSPNRLQPDGIWNATRLCALTVWHAANE